VSKYNNLLNKIERKNAALAVIGLGYTGLPTALFYAKAGYKVIGVDTSQELIDELKQGKIRVKETGLKQIAQKYLTCMNISSSYDDLIDTDICALCLPSPIDNKKNTNLSHLENSIHKLSKTLENECLILIESTVPVGTTERLANLYCSDSGMNLDDDVWFAHCPERVLPGNIVQEMDSNHRLAGGVTQASTELATKFLSAVFSSELIHPTTSRISEGAKLAENAFRDINIAYANELAKLCTTMSIDVHEVLRLANLHPRVNILNPGIGVGGYCLPKDGWILVDSSKESAVLAELIPTARKVNDSMPTHLFGRIQEAVSLYAPQTPALGILGLSFKPNVSDTRNSPSLELIKILTAEGMEPYVYDSLTEDGFGTKKLESMDELLDKAEIIVLCVAHDCILDELRQKNLTSKTLVDPGNFVSDLKSQVKHYIGLSS
jgi:UDP-N-acetyl-D-mannosaminuronic acid dehydrogenase